MLHLIFLLTINCISSGFFLDSLKEQPVKESKKYHVAIGGNDLNQGTIDNPWSTLQKAIKMAHAGDTVFIHKGTYYPSKTIEISPNAGIGHNGHQKGYIHIINYPGEKPVFDFVNFSPAGNYATGLYLNYANYIHIKGITIRNVEQKKENVEVIGVYAFNCSNIIFENIKVYECDGNAFRYSGALGYYGIKTDSTYFINCDAYNCSDGKHREPGSRLGGAADGFKTWNEPGAFFLFEGCRAWNCSDDGFDLGTDPLTIINNCWSFNNGFLDGDGTGFKTGGMLHDNGEKLTRVITNNIAAGNRASGFFLLEYPDYYRTKAHIFNNFSYANKNSGFSVSRNELHPLILAVWKNNISYKNEGFPFVNAYQMYSESHNSWKRVNGFPGWKIWDSVQIDDFDFISLDISQLSLPRKQDGSLPAVTFGHLVKGSDLKGKGTYLGMSSKPDLGVDWDYLSNKMNSTPY